MFKSKTISYLLLLIIILFFIILIISINYVSNYQGSYSSDLKMIETYSKNNNWEEAQNKYNNLEKRWQKIKNLIAINYTEQDYSNLNIEIFVLKAAIKEKNLNQTMTSINKIINYWDNLISIIPEP